jgi:hypothetical protein
MTSQLVLGNGFGVGLASDSAVTIEGGVWEARTYETSEKIFPLPMPHRLAVLTAGALLLDGLPFDVLLKEWIRSLGDARESQLRSVELYRESFLSWLRDNMDRWATSERRDEEALSYLAGQLGLLRQEIELAVENAPEQEAAEITLQTLRESNARIVGCEPLESVSPEMAELIFDRLWEEIEDHRPGLSNLVAQHFEGLQWSEETDYEVRWFLRHTIEKCNNFPSGTEAHLAFVGYGSTDLLPRVATLQTGGAIEGQIWRRPAFVEHARADGVGYGLIYTQAQDDQIALILRGYDQKSSELTTRAVLGRIGDSLEEAVGSEDSSEEKTTLLDQQTLRDAMSEEADRVAWETKLGPARATVAILPLATLVDTARSLVAVQTLSQTIRGVLPTVGGKIEAATITLSEGFQWHTRSEFRSTK